MSVNSQRLRGMEAWQKEKFFQFLWQIWGIGVWHSEFIIFSPVCLLPLQKRLDSNPYSHILGHPNGYNHDNCIIFAMLRICCATFQTSSKKSSRDIYWLMDHPTAWERLFPKSGPRVQRVILSTYHQPSASGSPPPSYSTLQHPFRASRQ